MSDPVFVIVAPNLMALRAIVSSNVLQLLNKKLNQKILLLSPKYQLCDSLPAYVEWRDYLKPNLVEVKLVWWRRIIRAVSIRFSRWFGFGYANTVFRFNQLQQFYAHSFKQNMSNKKRLREELAGNFVSRKYGFPFPNAKSLYDLIYKFYYSIWQVPDQGIEQFFSEFNITRLVFWHVQNEIYRDYSVCARKKGIAVTAVIGSWDRLTTKGPICPGCSNFVVNSQVMKKELMQYHDVDESLIDVVGWPQMDIYHDKSILEDRDEFLKSLDIPSQYKIILYAGNASRLGEHEPGLVEYLSKKLNIGHYGEQVYLLVRPHPQDVDWQQRYQKVMGLSNVKVMPAEVGNIKLMMNTISHADIVIAAQGSISLDAVAFDKCVINIAFDGNLTKPYYESASRCYEMDHYRPVVESGGVRVVNDFSELDSAIIDYLNDQTIDSAGRERLRYLQLSPFEGDSSERQVNAMTA